MRASAALAYGIGIATAGINFFYQAIAGTARLVCHQRVVKQAVDQVMATSRHYYNNFFQQSHTQIIARHNQYFSSRRLHEQSDLQNYVLTSAREMRDYLAGLSPPLSSEIPVSPFDVEAALNNDSRCDMIAAIDQLLLWTSLVALLLLCGVRIYASYCERPNRQRPDPPWARATPMTILCVDDEEKDDEIKDDEKENDADAELTALARKLGVDPQNDVCKLTQLFIKSAVSFIGSPIYFEEKAMKDWLKHSRGRTPWNTPAPPLVRRNLSYLLSVVNNFCKQIPDKKIERKYPVVSQQISPEPQLRQRAPRPTGLGSS